MKNIITFFISKEDEIYTASAAGHFIVTEGKTFENLLENIKDAVSLYFESESPESLGFQGIPSILLNYELEQMAHA